MFMGKLLGALFGYWLFSIYGAIVGLVLGFFFDRSRAPKLHRRRRGIEEPLNVDGVNDVEDVRQSFFSTTFAVLGHVAKADGQVRQTEIDLVEDIMLQMGLDAEMRKSAIRLFTEGKQADFDLELQVRRFRADCAMSTSLYRVFLEIQIQAALADGRMVREEEAVLLRVANVLGFPELVYRQIEMLVRASMGIGDDHTSRYGPGTGSNNSHHYSRAASSSNTGSVSLNNAFTVMGLKPSADQSAVKQAYRKLMNQHHPDKLVSKGLPEEMLRVATDKTQEIQKAYELIRTAKGW